jgi:hypothetical protein
MLFRVIIPIISKSSRIAFLNTQLCLKWFNFLVICENPVIAIDRNLFSSHLFSFLVVIKTTCLHHEELYILWFGILILQCSLLKGLIALSGLCFHHREIPKIHTVTKFEIRMGHHL